VSRAADLLRDIATGARAQPGRAALAFCALALGSCALALMAAVLGGFAERSAALVREFGASLVALISTEAPSDASRAPALTVRTAEILARNLPDAVVAGARRWEAASEEDEGTVALLAVDARLARARGWTVVAGRFLDGRDIAEGARSAVLTLPLARTWNAHVGQSVRVGGALFRVVGLVDCGGTSLAAVTDRPALIPGERAAFIPRTTLPVWLGSAFVPDDALDVVFVRLPDDARFAASRERLARLLGDPRLTGGAHVWIESETILRGVRRVQRALDWGAGGIALLSLAMGGIMLAGLLAGNVRERTVEIGLRRALGATRSDVAALFVAEGLALSVTAALTGSAAAYGLVVRWSSLSNIPIAAGPRLWLAPLTVAVITGLLASGLPARAAAHAAPADALRAD